MLYGADCVLVNQSPHLLANRRDAEWEGDDDRAALTVVGCLERRELVPVYGDRFFEEEG